MMGSGKGQTRRVRSVSDDGEQKLSHRKLGEKLDLFHFSDNAPGMPFWHSRGLIVLNKLTEFCREQNRLQGYEEVRSPQVWDSALWEKSGHWDKFQDNMFKLEDVDERRFALKPMNCPGHADLFASRPRSYKELPLRISEQGHVHRMEPSGSVNGLLRARAFTQDDGHVFCREDQVQEELTKCLETATTIYEKFGLQVRAELSLRPQNYLGGAELWDKAEIALHNSLLTTGVEFRESPGEGAFYGPKVDLHISDNQGRDWQMGSVQLDYQMPQRFDLSYVNEDDQPSRPVMIHRAYFGSYERFVGILLENTNGYLPLWVAPETVRVLPISLDDASTVNDLSQKLRGVGAETQVDSNATLGVRIRNAELLRVPVIAVVGKRERENNSVALRFSGDDAKPTSMGQDEFIQNVNAALIERKNKL